MTPSKVWELLWGSDPVHSRSLKDTYLMIDKTTNLFGLQTTFIHGALRKTSFIIIIVKQAKEHAMKPSKVWECGSVEVWIL